MKSNTDKGNKILLLMNIENSLRNAESLDALRHCLVNQTKSVIRYSQSVLLEKNYYGNFKVSAIGNLLKVENNASFVQWIESLAQKVVRNIDAEKEESKVILVDSSKIDEPESADWAEYSFANGIFILLVDKVAGVNGVLFLSKNDVWDNDEITLCRHLSDVFGFALNARNGNSLAVKSFTGLLRKRYLFVVLFIVLLMFLPVHMRIIAPAEIIPKKPFTVTSPIDGVVKEILVDNNQKVDKGQKLVSFEKLELENSFKIAKETLNLAKAEYKRIQQAGFINSSQNYQLSKFKAQIDLREAELKYAGDRLKKTTVLSYREGTVIVMNIDDFKGKPVKVGEKILVIADQKEWEMQIMVPVADAVGIKDGAEVTMYLHENPMTPIKGHIYKSDYSPSMSQEHILSYKVIAKALVTDYMPRFGLKGSAKIKGERVSLFYYLFRKPITAFRQWSGI